MKARVRYLRWRLALRIAPWDEVLPLIGDLMVERGAQALHDHDLAPGEPPCDMCRSRVRAVLEAVMVRRP